MEGQRGQTDDRSTLALFGKSLRDLNSQGASRSNHTADSQRQTRKAKAAASPDSERGGGTPTSVVSSSLAQQAQQTTDQPKKAGGNRNNQRNRTKPDLEVDDASHDAVHHLLPLVPRLGHPVAAAAQPLVELRGHLVQLHRVPGKHVRTFTTHSIVHCTISHTRQRRLPTNQHKRHGLLFCRARCLLVLAPRSVHGTRSSRPKSDAHERYFTPSRAVISLYRVK